MRRALLLAALAVLPAGAHAFGPFGHQIVAEIAARHLEPAAKREVERLFGQPAGPALQQAATWPDEIKELPGYGALAPLHYTNVPAGACVIEPARDCQDGRCVYGMLDAYIEKVGNASNDALRAEAVKWLVHLVGDVHTPLHVGLASDKGGNDFQIQFEGQGSNLHRLWDSQMLATRKRNVQQYADALEQSSTEVSTSGTAIDWAGESCRIRAAVYPDPKRRTIGADYVAANLPILDRRLREAGLRLAAILNRTLDKPAVPKPYR